MKTAFRFLLIISIMVLPFLIQPALALYFEHDPNDPAEHAPFKEGENRLFRLTQKTRLITFGKPPAKASCKAVSPVR